LIEIMNRRKFLTSAAAAPAIAAAQSADNFTPLFDGRTLAGWSIRQGPESAFYVRDGAIVVHHGAGFPCWLRSAAQYENFDFRGEFFVQGWIDSGIYFHAPEHGRNSWEGMQMKIFHQQDEKPMPNSTGSIFPLIAPLKVNVKSKGDWNEFRILMDWPGLRIWTNGELVQDLNVESVPELRHRLRRGYLGLASLSYPIRFRNLRIQELPPKEKWQTLYHSPADFDQWFISEGKPQVEPVDEVLWADGQGHIATKEKFRDFELRMYVRGSKDHNSGVLFRTSGQGLSGRHYEIQLHNVEEAHFPTGSLYYFKRSIYPKIEPEEWFPFHLIVQGSRCLVRINGDTVCEYDRLENQEEGHIELQAHRPGYWTEFKQIRVKPL
jgi:hypothetical protein